MMFVDIQGIPPTADMAGLHGDYRRQVMGGIEIMCQTEAPPSRPGRPPYRTGG